MVRWNDLESKINQIVRFESRSYNIDCNIRIIKVRAHQNEFYSRFNVSVFAVDEQSYNLLNSKKFDSDIISLWGCDGVSPQDSGLGYGKKGFRINFEDGEDVFFYSAS